MGLRNITFKHPWVFYIDADECPTPEAAAERYCWQCDSPICCLPHLQAPLLSGPSAEACAGLTLENTLLPPEFVHYERIVHPVTVVDGPIGDLQNPLDLYPFSKGLSHWIARHNSYSSFEAQQTLQNLASHEPFSLAASFLERNFNRRRFHQKELFYRLPARPLIKFLLLYILKRGFLDGRPGFTYTLLQCIYEAMIVLKVQELEQSRHPNFS